MQNVFNKRDIIAGFSVFVLALPLCLGIAMASNFPPIAGIIAAISGGLIASWFGGAALSIKGPAAGLIVIALGCIEQLGYERALAVGVVAAVLQIVLALWRKAVYAEIMPPSVIHGMLAAIGVIIIAKQLYVLLGITPTHSSPLALLANLPIQITKLNPIICMIGLLSLTIAIVWPYLKRLAMIPASLVVLVLVIPLSMFFDFQNTHQYQFLHVNYNVNQNDLIHLPLKAWEGIHFPDFSAILTWPSIKYIVMFTLVGSIESLLTACAVDSITHAQKPSNLNRDLLAIGVGNVASSLIGGLPMISEIVRSKANIEYGAESVKSNLYHGAFMLLAVLLLPRVLNLIPLSALAALLVYIGYKLASPRAFIDTYNLGLDQFILFLTTFIITLATDLLTGVACGVILKIIIYVWRQRGQGKLFQIKIDITLKDKTLTAKVNSSLVFLNFLKLKRQLQQKKSDATKLVIDISDISYIDHTAMKKLHTLGNELEIADYEIQGMDKTQALYQHKDSVRIKRQQNQQTRQI